MCGIAGSINFRFDERHLFNAMGHRGPDEQAGYQVDNVQLYHLRLAILDIAGGKQPMHYLDRYTIIFNGEIYNHKEVRQALGLTCRTNSDTETILQAFHKVGPDMLHHFDGMFAMAIYDRQAQKLFFCRDRAGKKPLYFFNDGLKFAFASELNGLASMVNLDIEEKNFEPYFRLGSFLRAQTPYKNVTELLNGHYAWVDCTTLKMEWVKWWAITDFYRKREAVDEAEAWQTVRGHLEKAVVRRLESSDLEVGCFLSGGIDSGLITALASKHKTDLRTFTVSFAGQFDESHLAKLVADKYATNHETISISFDGLKDDLEDILGNYGEPFFDSSAIPSYYVSKAASRHITVVLNGDGADELFGGYRRHVPFAHNDLFEAGKLQRRFFKGLANILPPGNHKKSYYNYLYRLAFLSSFANTELFLASGPDIFEGFLHKFQGLNGEGQKVLDEEVNHILSTVQGGLRRIMALDFEISLFSDLLVKMDIASMAHSLEGRSPMLAKELLEYAPGLPDKLKIRGATTKYLLRKIATDLLPAALINQPKRGFEIPLKNWVNNDLKEIINDYLVSPNAFFQGFISKNNVVGLLEGKWKVSDEKRAKMIWNLFCLEVWYKKCYVKA